MITALEAANQVIESCGSTNDLVRTLGEQGYPHGTWVSARVQEKGRGRLGREWKTAQGNLFLSLLARIHDPKLWTWVPLATAVGIVSCLRQELPGHDLAIKWPNDIFMNGLKAGGVLCEGCGSGSSAYIVVGIGLNCADVPTHLDRPATSLGLSVDLIRPKIIEAVLEALFTLEKLGPKRLQDRYNELSFLKMGDPIEWDTSPFRGKLLGLGPSGELQVILEVGQALSLYAEDVRVKAVPLTSA